MVLCETLLVLYALKTYHSSTRMSLFIKAPNSNAGLANLY